MDCEEGDLMTHRSDSGPAVLAYHGKPELKAAMLAMLAEHEAADQIVQGMYGPADEWRGGCAIGCLIESIRRIEGLATIEHDSYANIQHYLGVPILLANVVDATHEALAPDDARTWPRRFLEAMQPGADLSMVCPAWLRACTAEDAVITSFYDVTPDVLRRQAEILLTLVRAA